MDFSKDNLNITSASSLLDQNENSTSYHLTENFITGNDTIITGNGTASTERTVGNVTTPTDSPLQEYDYLNPVWNVAFSATVITGTAGNLIVLWIVLGSGSALTTLNDFDHYLVLGMILAKELLY